MAKANKPKKKPDKKRGEAEQPWPKARGYAIRFPNKEANKRAIMVLGDVGVTYVAVLAPDGDAHYGVTRKHLEALQAEGIPFEFA